MVEKFIAFVDISGFKSLVEAAEAGKAVPLAELLRTLASPEDRNQPGVAFVQYVCPKSTGLQRDLDFQVTQVSDCVVVSSEISPAGIINLIDHCWLAVLSLLQKGVMCRGYITRGRIYHTPTQFVGTGYQDAYSKEAQVSAFKREADERGTPFVEIDPAVCNYVKDCDDSCVKEMFSRFVKTEGSATALFPFQRLAHSFMIGGFGHKFDAAQEKRSNENVRWWIEELKKRVMTYVDPSKDDAVQKANHYLRALENQLAVIAKTDRIIDMLSGTGSKR